MFKCDSYPPPKKKQQLGKQECKHKDTMDICNILAWNNSGWYNMMLKSVDLYIVLAYTMDNEVL